MTREDAKYILSGLMKSLNEYYGLNDTGFKAFNMALKALEQEPCEDAVSREAIESILYELYEVCTNMDELVHCMDDNLKKLPSVTPKRMGKWISHYVGIDEDDYGWDCSECGEWFVMDEPYHYCPKCGAKMKGGKEE